MDPSPLRKLPAELREYIYELALHVSFPIVLSPEHLSEPEISLLRCNDQRIILDRLTVTQTCRDIRSEALPLFYSTNNFVFYTKEVSGEDPTQEARTARENEMKQCRRWLESIGPHSARAIRRFTISVPPCKCQGLGQPVAWWWQECWKLGHETPRALLRPDATLLEVQYVCPIHVLSIYANHLLHCHMDTARKCAKANFSMPTTERRLARSAVKEFTKIKGDEIKHAADGYSCCSPVFVTGFFRQLEKQRDWLLKELGETGDVQEVRSA